jgi:hypothetical protein
MKVVSINPKSSHEEKRKADMLDVLEEMKRMVESGEIDEFVACSIGDGECKIHASVLDLPGGVGLFEIGKHMIITMETE